MRVGRCVQMWLTGSIRRSLVSIIALAIIVPIAVISLVAFEGMKRNAKSSAISENQLVIRQIAKHFEYYFSSIDSIGLDVYRNQQVYNSITSEKGALVMGKDEKDHFFTNLITKNEDALCIRYRSLIDDYELKYAYRTAIGGKHILRIDAVSYYEEFYRADTEALRFDAPSVLFPHATAEGEFLVYLRKIYYVPRKQPVGELFLILRTNFLRDACSFYVTHEEDALALYSLGSEACLYANARATPELIAACEPFFSQVDDGGYHRVLDVNGMPTLVFLSKVPGYDIVALKAMPNDAVQLAVVKAARGAVWLFIPIAVLAITLAAWFGSGITRPIARLRESMVSVGRGEYGRRIDFTDLPNNEINAAVDAFNQMTCEIDRLVNESLRTRIRLQDAKLNELQATINPHFISNTLQSISWMAAKHNAYDVKYALSIFSDLMRYGISGDHGGVALAEEIQHARKYLTLHKLRLGDQIEYSLHVTDAAGAVQMPRLTVQPLVENSIRHGLDESGYTLHIELRAEVREDVLTIEVIDDGAGFAGGPEDVVARMKRAEEVQAKGSIGLTNVHARLANIYGERFDMEITSEPAVRTCVRIVIHGVGREEN